MIVSVTSIKLKHSWKFFRVSFHGFKIIKQLKTTKCLKNKTRGFWKVHYTMTLWENESQIRNFVKSDAHLKAMKTAKNLAKEMQVISYQDNELPTWKIAKEKLKEGKLLKY